MDNNLIRDSANVERGSDTAKNSEKAPPKKQSTSKGVSLTSDGVICVLKINFKFYEIFPFFRLDSIFVQDRFLCSRESRPEIANFW